MASTAPKRRLRDPNDIFAALDRPTINSGSPPKNDNPITASSPLSSPTKSATTATTINAATKTQYVTNSTTRYTKPQIGTTRRVMSISKRFMGTTGSLLRRNGSPPRGRRSPPPRRTSVRKTSGSKGGIKPPLDLGPQHSPYDTVNVRERVRKWQASGGGVIEADTSALVPPQAVNTGDSASRSGSRVPEKRRTMLADYTVNHNFDELETSSARWGMEPLALPAPPALAGYGSNAGSWKGSRPSSVISGGGGLGEWEDAMSGAEMSGREDKSAWNSAPEDKKVVTSGTKKKKKRVPREGMDVDGMRARKERRKKKLIAVSDHEREMERSVRGREETLEVEVIETSSVFEVPGIDLEATEDTAVVPMAAIDDAPPPLPRHADSMPALKAAANSMKSIEDSPSLNSKQSVKSLGGTPASVMSDPSKDETATSSLLDDDGIRVTAIRRKFTKAEKREIHKQRQAEREEFLEREKNRIREEERLRYQEIERIREEERQKEIERIKEEERQKVLEEEEQREEERRKIRELDLKAYREREEQKKREKEKEERRRQRELLREQERQREIERIREEEKLKVIEEMRIEQERERERQERERERLEEKRLEQERERERIDQERELARLDEQRRIAREEERHQEIMSEIERATQRSTTRAKKKKKEKENYMLEEVQKRVGPDALRSREEMASVIKATVVEVMGEMFGEIIFEDDIKSKEANDKAFSSSVTTEATSNVVSTEPDYDTRTRETTPETHKSPVQRARRIFSPLEKLEKSPPPMPPGHNDITYRPVEFRKTVPEILEFKRPFPMGIGFKRPSHQATELKKPTTDIVESKKSVPEVPEPKRPAPEIPEPNRAAPKTPEPKKAVPEIVKLKKSIPEIVEAKPPALEETNYKKPAVEAVPESPPERIPEPILEEPTSSPPGSPETPTKGESIALPKRRINLFGSQSAKRRRKPFQATIPEESASQLSVESEPALPPPVGRRDFSFAPRTAAEPISPPITRQVSAASQSAQPADAVLPPARQLSVASRASHHSDTSDHSIVSSSQIHRNLPKDENLDLPSESLSTGLTRSLTSPAAHTNLAKDGDPGDEYFVSVNEPLKGSGIKRYKSTADLISLLSERRPSSTRPKSIKSARSIRSVKNKVVVGTLTLRDLLVELATEELSYTEDLQLLEHRIIPVLLEAKLAKTDKDAAAGKRPSPEKLMENNPLKSIVDVNIALKRLNGVHDRLADAIKAATTNQADQVVAVPNPDEILKWAQAAKYVYEDYITYWRMDWDEVVINTNVLEAIEKKKGVSNVGSAGGVAGVLSGGVSAGNGKNEGTIDVGYLLKRPLVRTRVLTKLFKVCAIFISTIYTRPSDKSGHLNMGRKKLPPASFKLNCFRMCSFEFPKYFWPSFFFPLDVRTFQEPANDVSKLAYIMLSFWRQPKLKPSPNSHGLSCPLLSSEVLGLGVPKHSMYSLTPL
ncbi:hypothetical protein TWF569_010693 [Orbilia oligospora]|uniref:DBL homology domain-containing protein n=1 Tax=Orbilia oligospora TaxID=2813651 RepID=A0A7C8N688_ORBOL|nr:hypothetical protein TWF103_000715 [Orbilia oligospora]KAF3090579.1 hypothetical protein TWF102_009245 [Orbilia oligospora]KAF3108924.1 hypothetical protein TWF706_001755 [Orbilia oligospora]KAF3133252.1 hypothetical protein TWF569_010693 [Orbilia oligospora]KAF3143933.1 hypothetical protein TWF594_005001 [Orbilia oligospora]